MSRSIADLLAIPATDATRLGLPEMLQESLSDLLSKAQAACNYSPDVAIGLGLAKAITPWKLLPR